MRHYFFVDEAGNLDFTRKQGSSRYFILTSVTMQDCSGADTLRQLHRELVWDGLDVKTEFHATTEKQAVRDRVFDIIRDLDIRVDATIFEKRKAVPHRQASLAFLELAWFQHITHVIPDAIPSNGELHVIAASWGTHTQQTTIVSEIADALNQCGRARDRYKVSHWPASTDPCLQVADYCSWAIQRKWQLGDDRSHKLIKHLIHTEYDMWSNGTKFYY